MKENTICSLMSASLNDVVLQTFNNIFLEKNMLCNKQIFQCKIQLTLENVAKKEKLESPPLDSVPVCLQTMFFSLHQVNSVRYGDIF